MITGKKARRIFLPVLTALLLISSGCTSASLYSVNMYYDAAKTAVPAYLIDNARATGATMVIAEFQDNRQVDDPKIIGRVVEKDGMKVFVLPKYTMPSKAVAQGIKNYLVKAGYKIPNRLSVWNLKEETIPREEGKIIIGGSIDELELTCRKGFPTDTYISKIKLTVFFADLAKAKILYKSTVESSAKLEHALFSEKRMGEHLSGALAEAVEKLFEDKAVTQNIKDALSR